MEYNFRDLDIAQIKANADDILLKSQQEYENLVKLLGKLRDEYGSAIILNTKAYSSALHKILKDDPKAQITKAKESAKDESMTEYTEMVTLEQKKKKIQDYCEAIKERMNTIKMIMKVKYGHMQ